MSIFDSPAGTVLVVVLVFGALFSFAGLNEELRDPNSQATPFSDVTIAELGEQRVAQTEAFREVAPFEFEMNTDATESEQMVGRFLMYLLIAGLIGVVILGLTALT